MLLYSICYSTLYVTLLYMLLYSICYSTLYVTLLYMLLYSICYSTPYVTLLYMLLYSICYSTLYVTLLYMLLYSICYSTLYVTLQFTLYLYISYHQRVVNACTIHKYVQYEHKKNMHSCNHLHMYTIILLDRSWHLYHTVVYQAQLSFYKDHKHALMVCKWFHAMYFILP